MAQLVWESNNGDVPIVFEVQSNFIPVSGLSPTVELKRASDDYFADWTTLTFKAPGASGDKFGAMSGVNSSPGVYKRMFNPLVFGQVASQQVYFATHRVTIPSGTVVGNNTFSSDVELTQTDVHFFNNFESSGVASSSPDGMTATFVE